MPLASENPLIQEAKAELIASVKEAMKWPNNDGMAARLYDKIGPVSVADWLDTEFQKDPEPEEIYRSLARVIYEMMMPVIMCHQGAEPARAAAYVLTRVTEALANSLSGKIKAEGVMFNHATGTAEEVTMEGAIRRVKAQ